MLRRPRVPTAPFPSLPPDLEEVCGILARGLIRLRAHRPKSSELCGDGGESRLDFIADQSGHANPSHKRTA